MPAKVVFDHIYNLVQEGYFGDPIYGGNNGKSWTRAPGADDLGGSQSTYGWWFARIFVDPDDAKRMYVAGLGMYQSTDGADNFAGCCGSVVTVGATARTVRWKGSFSASAATLVTPSWPPTFSHPFVPRSPAHKSASSHPRTRRARAGWRGG